VQHPVGTRRAYSDNSIDRSTNALSGSPGKHGEQLASFTSAHPKRRSASDNRTDYSLHPEYTTPQNVNNEALKSRSFFDKNDSKFGFKTGGGADEKKRHSGMEMDMSMIDNYNPYQHQAPAGQAFSYGDGTEGRDHDDYVRRAQTGRTVSHSIPAARGGMLEPETAGVPAGATNQARARRMTSSQRGLLDEGDPAPPVLDEPWYISFVNQIGISMFLFGARFCCC
jgi:hypothetical protein